MGAFATAAGAHRRLAHGIARPAQARREGRIGRRRPDRQHAARLQGPAGGHQALRIVEPVVGRAAEPPGAIIDVEQDGVIVTLRHADQRSHVAFADDGARIVQAVAVEVGHRPARPGDHRGDQFDHRHLGLGAQAVQRRPEGEAHAVPADQHMG